MEEVRQQMQLPLPLHSVVVLVKTIQMMLTQFEKFHP
jgi:hypothetical protein